MPETPQAIRGLADTMITRFTPPSFVPGCQVKSIADISEYTTDNGWIEAVVGGDNQQRVRYYGTPQGVQVDDFVDVEYFPAYKLYRVFGATLGGTAIAGGLRVNKVWALDFTSESLVTDASDNVTINTGTLTLPSDIIHLSDPDNLISFTDDAQTFTVGGEVLLTLTEAAQDVVKIGDGGDVDFNINDDGFFEGSTGNFGIGTASPGYTVEANGPLSSKSTSGGTFYGIKSTTAAINDNLFVLFGRGTVSGSDISGGGMIVRAAENWSGSQSGTDILFVATAPGAFNSRFIHTTFKGNGNLGVNGVTSPSTALDIGAGAMEFAEMTAPAAGAANTARLFARDDGDSDTELCVRFSSGLIQVIAPLEFGGISVEGNTTQTTIATMGTKVQILVFDTNEAANGATPDHTNDHITVGKSGTYMIMCSITAESVAGAGAKYHFEAYKNNGATHLSGVHTSRQLTGGGGDTGAIPMSGPVVLSAGDTIEAWVTNVTNTQNIIIEDINLAIFMIGVNA